MAAIKIYIFSILIFYLVSVKAIAKRSPLEPEGNEGCACSLNYNPVCGNDGKTYPNGCDLMCNAMYKPGLFGICTGACPCANSNFESLLSMVRSVFSPFSLSKSSNVSQDATTQTCNCPRIMDPVCGSDGETYANECELDCIHATNPNIAKLFNGVCE